MLVPDKNCSIKLAEIVTCITFTKQQSEFKGGILFPFSLARPIWAGKLVYFLFLLS